MTTTPIDLGDGKTVPRHHIPVDKLNAFDAAEGAFNKARDAIRTWVTQLCAMQAPPDYTGTITCNAPIKRAGPTPQRSRGRHPRDPRDLVAFQRLGFSSVPSGTPPRRAVRKGLVVLDSPRRVRQMGRRELGAVHAHINFESRGQSPPRV